MQILDWDFAQDLSSAEHIAGAEEIRFTRAERSLLQALMSYKGRIWTRAALLDAVSGIDEEASERSIDFIINRLRRKLRDQARQPRYIETRYGEGYIWIAGSSAAKPAGHAGLPPIRTRLRGNGVMSYCDRPQAERAVIKQYGDSVLVFRLQGFLFFGAANRLAEEAGKEADGSALDYLILDFRDVLGLDDTAMPPLERLQHMAQERACQLLFSSVRPVLERRLDSLEARQFATLDAALEWREAQILAANPVEVPVELPLSDYMAKEVGGAGANIIQRHFQRLDAPLGTDIIQSGTHTREMFFLERGTVEVLLDIEGSWVRASRLWPGTLFGEIGFHCGVARTATLRTLEPCRLVCMDRPAFARLEADFPSLAAALHRFLAGCAAARLVFYNDMVVDFFRSTPQ